VTASVAGRDRRSDVRAAMVVEWSTIGWMVVEGGVGLAAGIDASSIALVAFGLDSLIEITAAAALLRRLRFEWSVGRGNAGQVARADRAASRVVGWSLLALAVYATLTAGYDLWAQNVPAASIAGLALAAATLVVMPLLIRSKLRLAAALDSRALRSDAMCGIVCVWMAGTLLLGLGVRAVFGWWWADPVAALALVYFIVREGREALG